MVFKSGMNAAVMQEKTLILNWLTNRKRWVLSLSTLLLVFHDKMDVLNRNLLLSSMGTCHAQWLEIFFLFAKWLIGQSFQNSHPFENNLLTSSRNFKSIPLKIS